MRWWDWREWTLVGYTAWCVSTMSLAAALAGLLSLINPESGWRPILILLCLAVTATSVTVAILAHNARAARNKH